MLAAPLLFFVLLELALRLTGFGYPTSFLLPFKIKDQKVLVQNDRFAWRFFGPNLARQPAAFAIAPVRPANTVRLFVFGESAAYGDPQCEYGLPRMLEALLSLRYPGVRFEVVNAAMTGINSHAILPIARDCARAGGDIWVIYMGNNEVVGPFGAGTVFGPQAPRLALIRAALAVKTTRTGQLLDSLIERLHPAPSDKSEWGGMLMFLDHQVRADEPRMTAVYDHFERNLADLIQLGHRSGAGVVVSTIAVNLEDCAPFASQHQPGLAPQAEAKWRELFARGNEALAAGHADTALSSYRDAEQIDDRVADLQFVMGRAALALGQNGEAQRRLSLARDLDALRFRCDSRLNETTRRLASGREQEAVRLADAEQAFARQAPGGVPGAEFFYEHVHLTFEGNYLLARTIAEQVEPLLPEPVRARAASSQPWPAIDACARRLAWTDCQRLAAVNEMLGRISDPPFTGQLTHPEDVQRLGRLSEQLRPGQSAAVRQAEALCREALQVVPGDATLHSQHARLLGVMGDFPGAVEAARHAAELLPNSVANWTLLGGALGHEQKYGEALEAYHQGLTLDPGNYWAWQDLAQTYEKMGRQDDAIREYRHVLRLKPRLGTAWLAVGQLLEQAGQKVEAEKDYRLALQNRIHRAGELTTLAEFCRNRGWFNEALTNYLDALKLSPADPNLRVKAGMCYSQLGRNPEAAEQYAEAARLDPNSGRTHFLLGLALGRQGKPAEATDQFRQAVRLMPEVPEAHLNLGLALMNQGRNADAMEEFHEVLRRSPTNAMALRYVEQLRAQP